MADLFRKSALDTMSTPEQLDKQVKIVRPATWTIGVILVVGLFTFILWSCTYQISNGITMSGVIFTNNDVAQIKASRDTVASDVLVKSGEHVDIGDIIAVISDEELLGEIRTARTELAAMESGSDSYEQAKEAIDDLTEEYIARTVVKSNCSGYVQSVLDSGDAVEAGESIVTIMPDSGYNEVVAYVPIQTAQNLSVGMQAQISPDYAPREEYGYMTGVVTEVSDTPVTEDSIVSSMGTLSYVENILPESASVEVHIKIDMDESSANQYRWSNAKGENLTVELGTECTIIAITGEYRPVELLLG